MPSEDVLKIWAPSTPVPQWKQDYYSEVILKGEIRLLGGLGHDQILQVGPETVQGERKVLIKDGKATFDIQKVLGVYGEAMRGEASKSEFLL